MGRSESLLKKRGDCTGTVHTAPVKDFAHLDISRVERTSIPEFIFCENKSVDQILLLARKMHQKRKFVMGYAMRPEYFTRLKKAFRAGVFNRDMRARFESEPR